MEQCPAVVSSNIFHVGIFRQQVFNSFEVSLSSRLKKFIRYLLLVRHSLFLALAITGKREQKQKRYEDQTATIFPVDDYHFIPPFITLNLDYFLFPTLWSK